MKKRNSLRKGITGLIVLIILTIAGTELFQGQRAAMLVNEKMFNYDENDPYIDRPTREALSHVVDKTDDDLDIITDANGFDNFEIGIDFAEQMLVSNPRNPQQMQFGVNNSSTGQNAYYTSNGYDWTNSNPSYHSSICCDPWSAWDSLGNLIYGSGVSGQYVYKSTNGGQTYGAAVLSVSGNDRNTLAADQTGGPYSNYLYAAITPGNFARSTNNGATWTQTFSSSNTIPGTMIAVGPNGSVQGGCIIYVTNTGTSQNVTYSFHRSTNGGANFTANVSSLTVAGYVGTLNSAGRLVINNGRTRPYPMIAMDNSYGPYRGRLYLVYASNVPAGNGNKPDIILQYSTNQGTSWSNRITVNDNSNPQLSDQWFPAIWCEKETGRLYIKWYDTRENPAAYTVNVYATYTDDGGTTFAANQKLTTQSWTYPNPSCPANTNCYRGDYDGCTANPKTSFNVWYDGRLGTYKNVGAYFPDFGMLATPSSNNIHQTNSSVNFQVNIPAVKLYTDVTTFSASVSPTPSTGSITTEFLGGNTLSSYPNSKYMKVKTVGTVTPTGNYTITITGQGSNGTPIHKRTVTVNVGTTVSAAPCESFVDPKFPPAGMFEEYSGTNYWLRHNSSAYGIGTGSAEFNFYFAPAGTIQSLLSNNFSAVGSGTYLTFDEAYAGYPGSVDTLVIETSSDNGVNYSTLVTLFGRDDGSGELNSAPVTASQFAPQSSQWRSKIYLLPAGTNKIRLKAKSDFGNNLYLDNVCVQSLASPVANNLSVVPEGYYTNGQARASDTVTVYLHRTDYPNIPVDSSRGVFNTSMNISNLLFGKALTGTYYKVVKHRNCIETWSKSGGESYVRGANTNFSFVNPSGQAYGNNQSLVDAGLNNYGMYSGEVVQDSLIDLSDIVAIFNDANAFVSGYVITDVTGDDFVDLTDLTIAYNNATNVVVRVAPPGGEPFVSDSENLNFNSESERMKYENGIELMKSLKHEQSNSGKKISFKEGIQMIKKGKLDELIRKLNR